MLPSCDCVQMDAARRRRVGLERGWARRADAGRHGIKHINDVAPPPPGPRRCQWPCGPRVALPVSASLAAQTYMRDAFHTSAAMQSLQRMHACIHLQACCQKLQVFVPERQFSHTPTYFTHNAFAIQERISNDRAGMAVPPTPFCGGQWGRRGLMASLSRAQVCKRSSSSSSYSNNKNNKNKNNKNNKNNSNNSNNNDHDNNNYYDYYNTLSIITASSYAPG
eukprot:350713-Chlamydomonas_euryale.AAC.4